MLIIFPERRHVRRSLPEKPGEGEIFFGFKSISLFFSRILERS
jgi:hypothetical protein